MSTVELAHTDAAVTPAPARHATPRRSSGSLLAASTSVRVTPAPTITKDRDRDTAGAGVAAEGMSSAVAVSVGVRVAARDAEAGLGERELERVMLAGRDAETLGLAVALRDRDGLCGEPVLDGDLDGDSMVALLLLGVSEAARRLLDGDVLAPNVCEADLDGDRLADKDTGAPTDRDADAERDGETVDEKERHAKPAMENDWLSGTPERTNVDSVRLNASKATSV